MSETTNEGGGTTGFQIPMSIKKRKGMVDELLKKNSDINETHVLSFFHGIDEELGEQIGQCLERGLYEELGDLIRAESVRSVVRRKVQEIVRKKTGGGGFVLYSPNQGKKKQAKPVANFPTKLAAKKAELARYPPKDVNKLQRLRREISRLLKDPKKRAEKERTAQKQKGTDDSRGASKPKTESSQTESTVRRLDFIHRRIISKIIKESLFNEEPTGGSEWDEFISGASKQALSGDKGFQGIQKNVERKTHAVLQGAFGSIKKAVDKKIKLKDFGVKKDEKLGKTYLAFSATMDNVEVGPIYVYAESGIPRIELSQNAKVALTKVEPANGKMFRAELVTVQERILDDEMDLKDAIGKRDQYLTKAEAKVDEFVAGLSPLQLSMLKKLLMKKYRKLTN